MEQSIENLISSQIPFQLILKLMKANIPNSPLDLIQDGNDQIPQYTSSSHISNSYSTFQSFYFRMISNDGGNNNNNNTTSNQNQSEANVLVYYIMYVFDIFIKDQSSLETLIESSLSEFLSLEANYSYDFLFTIAKVTLLFGLINNKTITTASTLKGQPILIEYYITYSLGFTTSLIKCLNKKIEGDTEPIVSFLHFITDVLLSNRHNVLILSKRTKAFIYLMQTVRYITYSNEVIGLIKDIMISLYEWRLPKQLILELYTHFPQLMINYNQKSNADLINEFQYAQLELDLLKSIIDKETQLITQDPFQIGKCFYLTNSSKSGMSFEYSASKLGQSTIIFSFKWSPIPNEAHKYNIISFTKSSFTNLLSFVIENNEFIIYAMNTCISTKIRIDSDKTYLFVISLSSSSSTNKKGTIYIQYNHSPKMEFAFSGNYSLQEILRCSIGFFPTKTIAKDHFNGTIGTIIISNEILSGNKGVNLFKLCGSYDIIPHLALHQTMTHVNTYENVKIYKTKQFSDAFEFFSSKDIAAYSKYSYVIDPKMFMFNRSYLHYDDNCNGNGYDSGSGIGSGNGIGDKEDDKLTYNLRLLDDNNKGSLSKYKVTLVNPFSVSFDVINLNSAIKEFMLNDGIKYLTLHLIYYSNILHNHMENNKQFNAQLYESIYVNSKRIIDLTFAIESAIEVKNHTELDLEHLYIQIKEVIELLSKYTNDTNHIKGSLFISLYKSCVENHCNHQMFRKERERDFFLRIKADFFPFILTRCFYDLNDMETLVVLFKLASCTLIEEKTSILYTPIIMKKLMDFSDVLLMKKDSLQRKQYIVLMQTYLKYHNEINSNDKHRHNDKGVIGVYFYELQKYISIDFAHVLYDLINLVVKSEAELDQYYMVFSYVIDLVFCFGKDDKTAKLRLKIILRSLFALIDIAYYNDSSNYKLLNVVISEIIERVIKEYNDSVMPELTTMIIKMLLMNGLCNVNRKDRLKLSSINYIEKWPKSREVNQNGESMLSILKKCIQIIINSIGNDNDNGKEKDKKKIDTSLVMTIIKDIITQCNTSTILYDSLFSGKPNETLFLSLISIESLFTPVDIIIIAQDYTKLIYTHRESFWYRFIIAKCSMSSSSNTQANIKQSIGLIIEILNLLILDLLVKETELQYTNCILHNLANLLSVMHYVIKSPCKEVFISKKIEAILYGFFTSFDNNNLIYSKAYYLNQGKILAEQYFEFHIELYFLTENKSNFEFITKNWRLPNSQSKGLIPYLLDDRKAYESIVSNKAMSTIRSIDSEVIKEYGPIASVSYCYEFLRKCFLYLVDRRCNGVLLAFMDEFMNELCQEMKTLFPMNSNSSTMQVNKEKDERNNNGDDKELYHLIKSTYETSYSVNKDYNVFKAKIMKNLEISNYMSQAQGQSQGQDHLIPIKNDKDKPDDVDFVLVNKQHNLIIEDNTEKAIEPKPQPESRPKLSIDNSPDINLLSLPNPYEAYHHLNITNEAYFKASNKKLFLLSSFGIFFKEFYFKNSLFLKLKSAFFTKPDTNQATKLMSFPKRRKEFSNGLSPPLFLKQNLHFFTTDYFNITHKYFSDKAQTEVINTLPLYKQRIQLNHSNDIKITKDSLSLIDITNNNYFIHCELITPIYALYGKLTLTNDYIIYQNEPNGIDDTNIDYVYSSLKEDRVIKDKQIIFHYADIKEVLIRRYILMWQAIEFFLKNGTSHFINLFHVSNAKKFIVLLKHILSPNSSIVIDNSLNEFNSKNYIDKWRQKQIDNYQFINILNKYSSRTFKDLNQYYVFPWLLLSYTNDQEQDKDNNKDNMKLRDLSKAICVQTEEQMNALRAKYEEANQTLMELPISTHYSTSPFVYYYLVRTSPFTELLISLQNMQFEDVNRTFVALNSTLSVLTNNKDPRELIPEFYCSAEFMINLNCVDYGIKRSGVRLDDVLLDNGSPKTFAAYIDWIINQRKILNGASMNIGPWIDAIFGINQYSSFNSKNAFCFFSKYSFEKMNDLDELIAESKRKEMSNEEIIKHIKNKITIIINFGECPSQLLYSSLASSMPSIKNSNDGGEEDANEDFLVELMEKINDVIEKQSEILFFWENKDTKERKTISLVTKQREVINYSLEGNYRINSVKCKQFKLLDKATYKVFINSSWKRESWLSKGNGKIRNEFYIFEPKYSVIGLYNSNIIISGRYNDNTIKINHIKENEVDELVLEDFVSCVCKRNNQFNCLMFYSGLRNGRLIEWVIISTSPNTNAKSKQTITSQSKPKFKAKINRSLIAHHSTIDAICISESLDIIITAGRDHCIYIRKLYDFELLTVIPLSNNLIVVDVQLSPIDFLYAKCYNAISNKFCIKGFTLSGINFSTSAYDLYNTINFTTSGNIVVNYYDKAEVRVIDGGNLTQGTSKVLDIASGKKVNYFKFKKKTQMVYMALNEGFHRKKLVERKEN